MGMPRGTGTCGDGTIDAQETCDDGARNGTIGHCAVDCAPPAAGCGNGVIDSGEQCDDGDAINSNGCTNDCHNGGQLEDTYALTNAMFGRGEALEALSFVPLPNGHFYLTPEFTSNVALEAENTIHDFDPQSQAVRSVVSLPNSTIRLLRATAAGELVVGGSDATHKGFVARYASSLAGTPSIGLGAASTDVADTNDLAISATGEMALLSFSRPASAQDGRSWLETFAPTTMATGSVDAPATMHRGVAWLSDGRLVVAGTRYGSADWFSNTTGFVTRFYVTGGQLQATTEDTNLGVNARAVVPRSDGSYYVVYDTGAGCAIRLYSSQDTITAELTHPTTTLQCYSATSTDDNGIAVVGINRVDDQIHRAFAFKASLSPSGDLKADWIWESDVSQRSYTRFIGTRITSCRGGTRLCLGESPMVPRGDLSLYVHVLTP